MAAPTRPRTGAGSGAAFIISVAGAPNGRGQAAPSRHSSEASFSGRVAPSVSTPTGPDTRSAIERRLKS